MPTKTKPMKPVTMTARRAAVLLVLLSGAAFAKVEQSGAAQAAFSGKGPAGFKLEGKTSAVRVEERGATVAVAVPLAGLSTGIDLRDKHMKEKYLEVQKFPEATLEVERARITLPADGQKAEGKATGKMTLHGQSKELPFTYVITRAGSGYQVQARMPLNMKEFAINVPSYMGITVQPDIETTVSFAFKE